MKRGIIVKSLWTADCSCKYGIQSECKECNKYMKCNCCVYNTDKTKCLKECKLKMVYKEEK